MKKVILIILSILLILLSIIIGISKTIVPIIKNVNYEKNIENMNKQFVEELKEKQEQQNKEVVDESSDVPQNDGQRVGTYIGQYIEFINNKDYESAYKLLNQGFKDKYFPTLESYIDYAREKYSRQKSVEYVRFKIEGFVYVVDTVIKDLAIYENPQQFEQVFRFQETEPGVFNISFGI